MSGDLEYIVAISFDVGDLQSKLTGVGSKVAGSGDSIESKFKALTSSAKEFAGSLSDAFTGAVEKVADLATNMAKFGAVTAIGAAAYGVGHLNNMLEQTNVSLAAIFATQGFGTFAQSLTIAGDQVSKMKNDVKTLPGDLGQLAAIMTTIATPAAQGGANPDDIRKLAGRSMLAGRILLGEQYSPELVSREMANLLAGRAGAHNILGTRLGFIGSAAQKLNAEAPDQRLKTIQGKLYTQELQDAAKAFGDTWVTQTTTLADNFKYKVIGPITQPLFQALKHSMSAVNEWFDQNQGVVDRWTSMLGSRLVDAWHWGVAEIEKWLPAIESFASQAYRRLSSIWRQLEPVVERFGASLRASLADGTALARIESILKLYAAIQIGKAAAPALGIGLELGKLALAGAGGGGATGGALAAAALPVTAGLAALAVSAWGAQKAMDDSSYMFHDAANSFWESGKKHLENAEKAGGNTLDVLRSNLQLPVQTAAENAGTVLAGAFDLWATSMEFGAKHVESFASAIGSILGPFGAFTGMLFHDWGGAGFGVAHNREKVANLKTALSGGGDTLSDTTKAAIARKMPSMNATVNVDRVEISIASNNEPSRLARTVKQVLGETNRYRKSSPYTPDYTGSR